ncbi:MAG: DUF2065 family protein [Sphingomonadales bacterium]
MSALAIVIIAVGLLIIFTRGPFIFAPEKTRAQTLRLFETDKRMRTLGMVFSFFGAVLIWASLGETGGWAVAVYLLGVLAVIISALLIIPFPGRMRGYATRIWAGFSQTTLRVIGVSSTAVGLLLVYYGLGL